MRADILARVRDSVDYMRGETKLWHVAGYAGQEGIVDGRQLVMIGQKDLDCTLGWAVEEKKRGYESGRSP